MLDIKQIESFYPENLRAYKRNLLREYLQYKILEIIFDSEYGDKIAFLGGTAIHILHSNTRFSEDLDFDNLGLTKNNFVKLTELVRSKLKLQGCDSYVKNVFKQAFRSYIRIPKVLFENKLSGHKEERLLIQLDAEPQRFKYRADRLIINKFDVFLRINAVPQDILLSQKIYCIFKRRRQMGRDFYDAAFLMAKTKPNMDYLKAKLGIGKKTELTQRLLLACEKLDFKLLAKELEPFLFIPADSKKVLFFKDYVKNYEF